MKRTNVIKEVRASRAGYFASPSFWVCEATDENYRILRANNVPFTQNTFVAANGERCTRFEFKEEFKMKTNNYTFKGWHNGAGAHYVYDIQAKDIREAYEKAYGISHSTPGVDNDVELLAASTLQVWEVGLTAPTKFPMFFTVQAYSESEAIVAAEQHCSEEYPSDYSVLYVAHQREVK